MRALIQAGRVVVSFLDALATLCLGVTILVYGLAWTASLPFALAGRSLLALSRRITQGAARPRSPASKGRAP